MWSPSAAPPRSNVLTRFTSWPGPLRHWTSSGAGPGTTRERWHALNPNTGRGRPAKDAPPRPGHALARELKSVRWSLWKNPEDLTDTQQAKLAWVAKTDTRLYRAYLLKEGLRHVFSVKGDEGKEALDRWLSWARRCRIPIFVELAARIKRHRVAIDASLDHGMSNALVESTNTKIRLLTRIAFGFRSPQALIALAMLALGGHRPALPGRQIDPRIRQ
jgi:transposase